MTVSNVWPSPTFLAIALLALSVTPGRPPIRDQILLTIVVLDRHRIQLDRPVDLYFHFVSFLAVCRKVASPVFEALEWQITVRAPAVRVLRILLIRPKLRNDFDKQCLQSRN